MRGWQYDSVAGGLEKNLVLKNDLPSPELSPRLGDAEIIAEVISVGINPADYKVPELGIVARAVISLPATPGRDFCGRITKIGRKVDSFAIGDIVFGRLGPGSSGTLAESVVVSVSSALSLPIGVDPDDAAASLTTGLTAYDAIKPNVKAGDKVFINGGSGGVGTIAIQICKVLGCHVTVSCSTGKVALCKQMGADEVIDYTTTNVTQKLKEGGQVFSLVLDNVGTMPQDLYKESVSFLLPTGKFVQIGGGMDWENVKALTSKMLLPSFLGGVRTKFEFLVFSLKHDSLVQLAKWLGEGKIKPPIEEVFTFEDVPKAFEKLKTGKCSGKLVIHVQETSKV